ncbi:MAG TPA: hypothetical protein VEB23_00400 [Ramlibacter sp.]|nr:hypothetical protein [Ramlibacter sp.]
MKSITSIAQYCVSVGAAVACAAVFAMRPPHQHEMPDLSNAQLKAAYLDCTRISSESLLEPDLITICSTVASALLQREFGGDVEAQLQWRRSAREDANGPRTATALRNLDALLAR